jgi:hypothetical protein
VLDVCILPRGLLALVRGGRAHAGGRKQSAPGGTDRAGAGPPGSPCTQRVALTQGTNCQGSAADGATSDACGRRLLAHRNASAARVDQSARDRAGFYLSVVCGGDFGDIAHLNAEFGAERLWKPVGEVLRDSLLGDEAVDGLAGVVLE